MKAGSSILTFGEAACFPTDRSLLWARNSVTPVRVNGERWSSKSCCAANSGRHREDVDTGVPPPVLSCKQESYIAQMHNNPSCAGCHALIDNIGFGLENYGPAGEWRTTEVANPDCAIDGYGSFEGQQFAGAASLGEALVETGELEGCFMEHFYQFVLGREVTDQGQDVAVVDALASTFETEDDLAQLMLTFASSDAVSAPRGAGGRIAMPSIRIPSWHGGFFAKLVARLAETPEPVNGAGNMLDSTAVVHMHSGGRHPSNLFQTIIAALGVDQDLGDLPGTLPDLLV